MGPFKRSEAFMGILVVLAVFLVISAMLLLKVVDWDDVLVWFATLVTLADGLNRVGFVTWVARAVASRHTGLGLLFGAIFLTALLALGIPWLTVLHPVS